MDKTLQLLYQDNFRKTNWGKLINFTGFPCGFTTDLQKNTSSVTLFRYLFPLSLPEITTSRNSAAPPLSTNASYNDGSFSINEMGNITPYTTIYTRSPLKEASIFIHHWTDSSTGEQETVAKDHYSGCIGIEGQTGVPVAGTERVAASSSGARGGVTVSTILLCFVLNHNALIDLDTMSILAPEQIPLSETPLGSYINIGGTNYRTVSNRSVNDSSYQKGVWLLACDQTTTSNIASSSSYMDYPNTLLATDVAPAYLTTLPDKLKEKMLNINVPYGIKSSSSNGRITSSDSQGSLNAQLFFPSCSEFGFSSVFKAVTEGAVLDYFKYDIYNNYNYNWSQQSTKRVPSILFNFFFTSTTRTSFWTRTPISTIKSRWGNLIARLDNLTDSFSSYYNADSEKKTKNNFYVCLAVNPEGILVNLTGEDGTLIYNNSPEISSVIGFLESQRQPPSYSYTVLDKDSEELTISEYFGENLLETYTWTPSSAEDTYTKTLTTVAAFDDWQKLPNGDYNNYCKIVITDGKDTVTKNLFFTKKVSSMSGTLKSPLSIDGNISAAILGYTGEVPLDCEINFAVSNNGGETWQDATVEVKENKNIVFADIGNSFNFKFNFARGESD